jgi:hypothetical protein
MKDKPTIIRITAKCSDLFSATLHGEKGQMGVYDGYVPEILPGEHYGDYVMLDIELSTGRILNWKPPTTRSLARVFK